GEGRPVRANGDAEVEGEVGLGRGRLRLAQGLEIIGGNPAVGAGIAIDETPGALAVLDVDGFAGAESADFGITGARAGTDIDGASGDAGLGESGRAREEQDGRSSRGDDESLGGHVVSLISIAGS